MEVKEGIKKFLIYLIRFGANLKFEGKKLGKTVTNFGACRDLNGRRLRNVNNEIALLKWQERQEKKELAKLNNEEYKEYKIIIILYLYL